MKPHVHENKFCSEGSTSDPSTLATLLARDKQMMMLVCPGHFAKDLQSEQKRATRQIPLSHSLELHLRQYPA